MEQKENGPSCPESAFGSRRLKVQKGPVLSIEPWAAGLDSLPPMGSAGAVDSHTRSWKEMTCSMNTRKQWPNLTFFQEKSR